MNPFLRGVLSIFDIRGMWSRNRYEPPPADPQADAEKLEEDWRRVIGEWRKRGHIE